MRFFITAILLAAVTAFGSACTRQETPEQSLARHQRLWAAQNIASYQYQLQVSCFCPPAVTDPVIIKVRDGTAESVAYAATGMPAESQFFERYDTLDKLFQVINQALEGKAAEISVSYDETLGFPRQIYIDFVKEAVDDEIAYNVSGFQVTR